MTPRAEAALSRAKAEADRLGDEFISAEHLLVSLTQEQQGPLAHILKQYGVDTERVYKALQKVRGQPPRDGPVGGESLPVARKVQHRPDASSRRPVSSTRLSDARLRWPA